MQIEWRQWEPNPDTFYADDLIAQAVWTALRHPREVLGYEHQENPEHLFLRYWKLWRETFPAVKIIYTLTPKPLGGAHELRAWFGEPREYAARHVGSQGHNLIVHVASRSHKTLRALQDKMLLDDTHLIVTAHPTGVDIWRERL